MGRGGTVRAWSLSLCRRFAESKRLRMSFVVAYVPASRICGAQDGAPRAWSLSLSRFLAVPEPRARANTNGRSAGECQWAKRFDPCFLRMVGLRSTHSYEALRGTALALVRCCSFATGVAS